MALIVLLMVDICVHVGGADNKLVVLYISWFPANARFAGEILMGNGIVTDLSPLGLGIRGNAVVMPGMELALFLYLPDGKDPLFVMETKVAWTSGRQFGVEIRDMGLREGNRLRHFLCSTLTPSE